MLFESVRTAVDFLAGTPSPWAPGVVMPSWQSNLAKNTSSRLRTFWTSLVVNEEAAAERSKT